MQKPDFYRYFLGLKLDEQLQDRFAAMAYSIGYRLSLSQQRRLHMTLCVIAEQTVQDRFIARRITAALARDPIAACIMKLGRLRAGVSGATLHAIGRQDDIRTFHRALIDRLAQRGIVPLRPRFGMQLHVTLGYRSTEPCSRNDPIEWEPDTVILVESLVGLSIHRELGRWRLAPSVQGELDFNGPRKRQSGRSI